MAVMGKGRRTIPASRDNLKRLNTVQRAKNLPKRGE